MLFGIFHLKNEFVENLRLLHLYLELESIFYYAKHFVESRCKWEGLIPWYSMQAWML